MVKNLKVQTGMCWIVCNRMPTDVSIWLTIYTKNVVVFVSVPIIDSSVIIQIRCYMITGKRFIVKDS